ncbi:hypothetical protein [Streptomyces sp. NPDC047042]|uniref:hypothetical protein n=1 Tax=Streptomyces sp. NPDC047042 TaxID=3154807 RepID=UPI0033EA21DB
MGDVAKAGIRTTTDGTAAGAAGVDEPEAGVVAAVEVVEVVELLVPGLGPVDRDALLWPKGVDRISGDNKAGLYRAGQPDTGVVPGTRGQPLVREVYDWTRLTIGGASRALWLFLLPFLLVNRVAWMQPRWPSGADGRLTKAAGALYEFGARLLALTLTVLVVGTFGQVAMDQFAWQCSPEAATAMCGKQAVAAVRGLPGGSQAALAVAALVPAVVVFVLLLVARDTKQEYLPVLETVSARETEDARRRRSAEGEDGHPLELRGFWEHNRRDPGIAAQHVWAGLLTTAALLTWTPLHESPRGSLAKVLGIVLFCVISAMSLVVVMSVPVLHRKFGIRLPEASWRAAWVARVPYLEGKKFTRPADDDADDGYGDGDGDEVAVLPLWPTRYPVLAGICCGGVNVAAVLYCLWPDRDWTVTGRLPGIDGQATLLLVTQGIGILLLLLGSVFLPTGGSRRGMALFGHAGVAVAVHACFLGWIYTVALGQWASSGLAGEHEGPVVTEPVKRMGMILLPVLLITAVCWAAISVVVRLLPLPTRAGRPGSEEPDHPRARLDKDDRRHLSEVTAARRRHCYLLRELDWLTGLTALAVVTLIVLFDRVDWVDDPRDGASSFVYDLLGMASIPLLAALATLMVLAFRTLALRPEMRQNAGLAWAFGAFWPRAVHPFAPPSWTVRAVPELVRRLRFLLRDPHRLVLIRAESMGAVLVLAAVWQLESDERLRIGLLSSGCPVRKHFVRQYPGFVCADSIRWLAPCGTRERLGAWINVWRDTDPLGGPMDMGCVDVQWSDDAERGEGTTFDLCPRTEEQPVFPPIEGHRGYSTDKRLIPLRDRLLGQLVGGREELGVCGGNCGGTTTR